MSGSPRIRRRLGGTAGPAAGATPASGSGVPRLTSATMCFESAASPALALSSAALVARRRCKARPPKQGHRSGLCNDTACPSWRMPGQHVKRTLEILVIQHILMVLIGHGLNPRRGSWRNRWSWGIAYSRWGPMLALNRPVGNLPTRSHLGNHVCIVACYPTMPHLLQGTLRSPPAIHTHAIYIAIRSAQAY
jgi:hypothetical protein